MVFALFLIQVLSAVAAAPPTHADSAMPWRNTGPALASEWMSGGLHSFSTVDSDSERSVMPMSTADLERVTSSIHREMLDLSTHLTGAVLTGAASDSSRVTLSGKPLSGESEMPGDRRDTIDEETPAVLGAGVLEGAGRLHFAYFTAGFSNFTGSFRSTGGSSQSLGTIGGSGGIDGGTGGLGGGLGGGLPGDGEGGGVPPRITPEPSSLTTVAVIGLTLTHRPRRRKMISRPI